jgi:hypothetical protein
MASTERLELPDGQWADILVSSLPHGREVIVWKASLGEAAEFPGVMVRQYVTAWYVRDALTGEPIATVDPDAASHEVVDAIFRRCVELRKERPPVPNASTASSSDGSSPE